MPETAPASWHPAAYGAWREVVPVAERTLRWIEDSLGPGVRIVSCRSLFESSTSTHRVEFEKGNRGGVVLRRYVDRSRLEHDPWYDPANEAEVLRRLEPTSVPAPRLLAFDPGRDGAAPALLTDVLPGHTPAADEDRERLVAELGSRLAQLHSLVPALADHLPAYEPYETLEELVVPAWSDRPGVWRAVIGELGDPPTIEEPRLVHRDPHPGNVLWDGETITGIVDWATGCAGPAAIDLARPRLNLAREWGDPWPDRLLEAYRAAGGAALPDQRWWDLRDAAEFIGEDVDEQPESKLDAERWDRFEAWVEAILRRS